MNKNRVIINSLMFIILVTGTLVYHENLFENRIQENEKGENKAQFINGKERNNKPKKNETLEEGESFTSIKVKNTVIPGNYLLQGFFAHDSFVNLDEDGNAYTLEEYDNMKDLGTDANYKRFQMDSDQGYGWPAYPDTYFYLKDNQNWYNSTMFTPVFSEDTEIKGKVHVLTHFNTNIRYNQIFTLNISLSLFNPSDTNTTQIAYNETILEDNLYRYNQKIFILELAEPIVIPENYRLKLAVKGKVSFTNDETTDVELDVNNINSGSYQWQITDEGYANTYTFTNFATVFGMQIKYKDIDYPSISVSGVENETTYHEEKNITITVSDSVNRSYRWDSDPFTSWAGSEVNVSLPTSDGWHYLEIKASDEFNNTRINLYKIGYDGTISQVELINPLNNSIIKEASLLNFTVSTGASNVTYEWDNNGTIFDLLSVPEYDIYAPAEDVNHNLTVYVNDTFLYEEQLYFFTIDSNAPSIVLKNVVNGSTYPAKKPIEVNITDVTTVDVDYKWDDQSYRSWAPEEGSIYVEYTPNIDGWNNLTVRALDEFNHENITVFRFYIDTSVLLVELATMKNNSFYYGGNDVNISISGYNNTVNFTWDNGEMVDGLLMIQNGFLFLNDTHSLPTNPNFVHYLYIYADNKTHPDLHLFIFKFTLDQEKPQILPDNEYNNTRNVDTEIFSFQISDNFTLESDMKVYLSIDGLDNISFSTPFEYRLLELEDGDHNLTVYAFDIAKNVQVLIIYFTVDTKAPTIEINSIEGLVELSGELYVPANATVNINIIDDDSNVNCTFSWDNSKYTAFSTSFDLNYKDGKAVLSIQANDSLNNENVYNLSLTIDSVAPQTSILFPSNGSKINHKTILNFQFEDILVETIDSVVFTWNFLGYPSVALFDESGYFEIQLPDVFTREEPVYLDFTTSDIVGNTITYTYNFNVDLTAPVIDLQFYNTQTLEYLAFANDSYIRGFYALWYDNNSNDDLASFEYSWDNGIEQSLNDTNYIDIPSLDGEHNLTVTLQDDTGEGTSVNTNVATFVFIVDDLKVDYISVPNNYPTNTTIFLEYGEQYNFIVSVSDIEEGTSITGLTYDCIQDEEINLDVEITQLDSITYEFLIKATNVTNGETTPIEIQFWQFENHKETLTLDVIVDKTEGNAKLQSISSEIIYGDNIVINVSLYDSSNLTMQEITAVYVNGTSVIDNTLFNDDNSISIIYNGYPQQKGNYSLSIYLESPFYFDELENIASLDVEIKPIPVFLSVYVSNTSVEYGNKLVIYANLTDHNGDPVPFVDITFYLYVYLNQSNQVGVNAAPEGYDSMVERITQTNAEGIATLDYDINQTIAFIRITAKFQGNEILDIVSFSLGEPVIAIPPPEGGIPPQILALIIAGSLVLMVIVSLIVYKVTRPKPFEKILEEITKEEINLNLISLVPGVILSLFDQRKGPLPIVGDHSFENERFARRMTIGIDNFLLRICDQAYSSLGFEEFDEKRRTGSIRLPSEDMLGYIHGIQLRNPSARGGFENLSLIIITEERYGSLLLGKEKYLHQNIDNLIKMLQEKKRLNQVKEKIIEIREKAVQVILATQIEEQELEKNK